MQRIKKWCEKLDHVGLFNIILLICTKLLHFHYTYMSGFKNSLIVLQPSTVMCHLIEENSYFNDLNFTNRVGTVSKNKKILEKKKKFKT